MSDLPRHGQAHLSSAEKALFLKGFLGLSLRDQRTVVFDAICILLRYCIVTNASDQCTPRTLRCSLSWCDTTVW